MVEPIGEGVDMVIHTTKFKYRPRGLQWFETIEEGSGWL